ncbi:MAG TPA: hypothetical protein VMF50_13535 [Candidatus Binataceae bacterium]|nr:hypothetical protein [Candidatus Binataceae bacterium]
MARRSILSPAIRPITDDLPGPSMLEAKPDASAQIARISSRKPSRTAKLHIGGYFPPDDPIVIAFQKLKVDLRQSQQDMLMEALRDFVEKHRAASAFR